MYFRITPNCQRLTVIKLTRIVMIPHVTDDESLTEKYVDE